MIATIGKLEQIVCIAERIHISESESESHVPLFVTPWTI